MREPRPSTPKDKPFVRASLGSHQLCGWASSIGRGGIRGKPEVLTHALVALFSEGHLLIEDVPGEGKTILGQALARALSRRFFNPTNSEFKFKPEPLFANVVHADEINRSTPKTRFRSTRSAIK